MKLDQYLSQLIKKDWQNPVERQFAGEVEDKIAGGKLSDQEAQKVVKSLYKQNMAKLAAASDDFWDLLEGIMHGITASNGGTLKKRALVVAELAALGINITEDEKVLKTDIKKILAKLAAPKKVMAGWTQESAKELGLISTDEKDEKVWAMDVGNYQAIVNMDGTWSIINDGADEVDSGKETDVDSAKEVAEQKVQVHSIETMDDLMDAAGIGADGMDVFNLYANKIGSKADDLESLKQVLEDFKSDVEEYAMPAVDQMLDWIEEHTEK